MAAVMSGFDEVETRFRRLFDREISPRLRELETVRQTQRRRALQVLAGMAALEAAVLLAVVALGAGIGFAAIASFLILALGLAAAGAVRRTYRNAARDIAMPAICEAIGDIVQGTGEAPDLDLRELEDLGLLPGHHRRRIDDVFRGRHRDVGFTMAEVELRRRGSRNRSRTVFRGLVFAIETPKDIPARILIAKDSGRLGNTLKGWFKGFGGMQRVALPHAQFEDRFEIYADRPEAALETVSPAFCENLLALAEAHRGAPLQAAFHGRRFYLAMRGRGDRFRVGSVFRPANALEEDARRVLHDVRMVHRLIDFLHGDRPDAL